MSQRQRDDMVILADIREQHRLSMQSYGRPRITEELQELGLKVGHRRMGRLMRENDIKIIRTQKYKATTDSNHTFNIASNLLDQDFLRMGQARNGPAHILHLDQRRVVVSGSHPRSVFPARHWLGCQQSYEAGPSDPSVGHRRSAAATAQGLHSSRYCFNEYQRRLSKHGFKVSMSGKGNCYDNSMVETCFKSSRAEGAIFQYINEFYNPGRRHSSLGGKSPLAFERKAAQMS